MPPAAFNSSTAISAECFVEAPSTAANPVSGAKNPILIASWAGAGPAARPRARSTVTARQARVVIADRSSVRGYSVTRMSYPRGQRVKPIPGDAWRAPSPGAVSPGRDVPVGWRCGRRGAPADTLAAFSEPRTEVLEAPISSGLFGASRASGRADSPISRGRLSEAAHRALHRRQHRAVAAEVERRVEVGLQVAVGVERRDA